MYDVYGVIVGECETLPQYQVLLYAFIRLTANVYVISFPSRNVSSI